MCAFFVFSYCSLRLLENKPDFMPSLNCIRVWCVVRKKILAKKLHDCKMPLNCSKRLNHVRVNQHCLKSLQLVQPEIWPNRKKDNDFIYNEIIPDVKSLENPGKAQLAKALPFTTPLSPNSKDLFADLVPVALHQAVAAADARKNEIVNSEVMRLREATQSLNGILASLKLPAAMHCHNRYWTRHVIFAKRVALKVYAH